MLSVGNKTMHKQVLFYKFQYNCEERHKKSMATFFLLIQTIISTRNCNLASQCTTHLAIKSLKK